MVCSRHPGSKAAVNGQTAVPLEPASVAPLNSTNHVDTSLKTCVESLSAVRRLHKDLANHIEVSVAWLKICEKKLQH